MKVKASCETCKKEVLKPQYVINRGPVYCNSSCYGKSVSAFHLIKSNDLSITHFRCNRCDLMLERDKFRWKKKSNGILARGYICFECGTVKRKAYWKENKQKEAENHRNLCKSMSQADNETQVRWWYSRHSTGWKSKAKRFEYGFDLTPDFMVELYRSQNGLCYYTGEKMIVLLYGIGHAMFAPDIMSLDRKDSKKGYTKDNVVLCTYMTNTSKGQRSEAEFIEFCRTVSERFK